MLENNPNALKYLVEIWPQLENAHYLMQATGFLLGLEAANPELHDDAKFLADLIYYRQFVNSAEVA